MCSELYILAHLCICFVISQHHSVMNYCGLWQVFELGSKSPPTVCLSLNTELDILESLLLQINFRIKLLNPQIVTGIFIRIVSNLQIILRRIDILKILGLPACELGTSLHLLSHSLISFCRDL